MAEQERSRIAAEAAQAQAAAAKEAAKAARIAERKASRAKAAVLRPPQHWPSMGAAASGALTVVSAVASASASALSDLGGCVFAATTLVHTSLAPAFAHAAAGLSLTLSFSLFLARSFSERVPGALVQAYDCHCMFAPSVTVARIPCLTLFPRRLPICAAQPLEALRQPWQWQ